MGVNIDFSIEIESQKIPDSRTRKHFEEVSSSYSNGNYRAAVVVLWSVVVTDILLKLDQLKTAYSDAAATSILSEIEGIQSKNPRSPDWEQKLLELVRDKTKLLELSDYEHLVSLQKIRHLSAHPVLKGSLELYKPNRDTVRALIRNSLESVLTKPAFMSRKVFDMFVEDLSNISSLVSDEDGIRRYLNAKYFPSLKPEVEDSMLRSLWKLVFRSNDTQAETNRGINFLALVVLFERRQSVYINIIEAESNYYSDVESGENCLDYLFEFLARFPTVYNKLTEAAKVPIQRYAEQDSDKLAKALFLSPNIRSHIDHLGSRITTLDSDVFKWLLSQAVFPDEKSAICDSVIQRYISCRTFNSADVCFEKYMKYSAELFSLEQVVTLLGGIEENSQTYARGRAKSDHLWLREVVVNKFGDQLDFDNYPRFKRSSDVEVDL